MKLFENLRKTRVIKILFPKSKSSLLMRSPEMWLNPGDHSSAITAEFCSFFFVCGCGCCYSPLQSPKILSLVSFAALAARLHNIHHFSQETNTVICMSTILQFSLKGVFPSWGINMKIWGQGFLFSCLRRAMLFASGGSNQLGRTNHLSGTETFISFFFSVILTQKTWLHPGYAHNKETVVYMHQSCGNSPEKVMLFLPNVSWVWDVYQLFIDSSKVA